MLQAYSMLCSPAFAAEGPLRIAPGMVALSPLGYWNGLQVGAAIQKLGVSTSTQNHRDSAMFELAAWLAKSSCTRGLHDCVPEDIIVYLVTWWAETHGCCQAPNGSSFAAPVSLEAICSHLAVEVDKRGRIGEWDNAALTGKPPSLP